MKCSFEVGAIYFEFLLYITILGTDRERGIHTEVDESSNQKLSSNSYQNQRSYLFDLPLIGGLQERCKIFRRIPFLQPYIRSYDFTPCNHEI